MTTTEGHDMPCEETPPITPEELDNIREHYDGVDEYDDVPRLLAEVDRLRAQVAQYQRSADEHVAKFDRKHEALVNAQAEVERLRSELVETKRERDDIATRFSARVVISETISELMDERDQLRAELKAAKSTRFENNGVGDVAAHIQAETINELRLN
jgi:cell division septum initiation protein DivIVA